VSATRVRSAPASVLDVVAAQLLAADPAACAVRTSAGTTSWARLDERAWAVAGRLAEAGASAGPFVPVLAARGGALVAAWLGVLRAGAAYAPLSLDTPPHRLEYVLAELGARVVLVDRAGEALLRDVDARVAAIGIDELAGGGAGAPAAPRPGDPAVVIYTSGTSGRPKGVVVTHRGLLNTVLWWADDVDLGPADRVLCTWATGFDGATHEVFRSLVAGAELAFADDVERRDPRALARLLRGRTGATVTSMTPSLLRAVLDVDPGGPTTLRTLYVGGEALPARLAEECLQRWAVPVRNIYGPTEASCISTVGPVDLSDGQAPAIGVPLPNTRAYVVGPSLEELPIGVPGELYVAGAGVALGYHDQPGQTASAFLPDPHAGAPGARMYRTGDRVVLRADGQIEHLGRVDDQVKILGHRVEPNEVRELLEEQPAVRAAAVRPVGDPLRLEAFVELATPDRPPTRDEVVGPLLRWLAPAVLPPDVFVVDALPMTANDKIDHHALAGMRSTRLPDAAARPVERTPDQRLAAELFATALGEIDRAGPSPLTVDLAPSANFFMLGGHSLLAVRMLAEADRRGFGPVPMRDFLVDPTVAGLGRLLGRRDDGEPAARVPDGERFPATSAQQRFWFLDRVAELRAAYLIPTVLELTGEVDRAALAAALTVVLARHPALRSRFELDRKLRRVFVRTDGATPEIARIDASGWSAGRLREHLATECWSPLDLAGGTPVRAQVIDAGDRTLLLLVVHHIVSDGWSQGLLLDQVAEAYRALIEGRDAELPPPVHPARLAEPAAAAMDARIASVVAALDGAPTDVPLPHDRARGGVQSTAAATVTSALPAPLAARLDRLAGVLGVTPFMTAASLLAVALARRSGQRDLLLALPWAGRDAPGSANAVGMLVNTLALRVDLLGEPTWRELLGRVRAASIACYRHADVPFDAVVAALHPDRDLGRPPLTPVYLDVRDRAHAPPDLGPGVAAAWRPLDPVHVKFELELTATTGAGGWELAASYPVALFDAGTVRGLLDAVLAAAADLADDPDAHLFGRLP